MKKTLVGAGLVLMFLSMHASASDHYVQIDLERQETQHQHPRAHCLSNKPATQQLMLVGTSIGVVFVVTCLAITVSLPATQDMLPPCADIVTGPCGDCPKGLHYTQVSGVNSTDPKMLQLLEGVCPGSAQTAVIKPVAQRSRCHLSLPDFLHTVRETCDPIERDRQMGLQGSRYNKTMATLRSKSIYTKGLRGKRGR